MSGALGMMGSEAGDELGEDLVDADYAAHLGDINWATGGTYTPLKWGTDGTHCKLAPICDEEMGGFFALPAVCRTQRCSPIIDVTLVDDSGSEVGTGQVVIVFVPREQWPAELYVGPTSRNERVAYLKAFCSVR
jgi:hypothetical protein